MKKQGSKILVIDDDIEQLDYISEVLNSASYSVFNAKSGESALEMLLHAYNEISVILLDIGLPDIDGIRLCQIIKSNSKLKNIPVIIITGFKEDVYFKDAFEAGCNDYILKPCNEHELLLRIKAHYDNYNYIKRHLDDNIELKSNIERLNELSDELKFQNDESLKHKNKLDLVLKASKAGLFEYHTETDFLIWDKRSFEIFGIDESKFEHNYNSWKECVHPDDIEQAENIFLKFLKSEKKFQTLAFRIIKKNDDIAYVTGYIAVERNINKKAKVVYGLHHDYTEQFVTEQKLSNLKNKLEDLVKQRTKELEIRTQELQLIFDHTSVIMILLDSNFKIIRINKAGIEFIGKDEKELLNNRFGYALGCINSGTDFLHCGNKKICDNCVLNQSVIRTQKTLKPQAKEEIIVLSNKKSEYKKLYISVTTSIINSLNENSILVTIDNITEQKKLQQLKVDSEEKYRRLFETKREAVLFLDPDEMKYIDVNQAACELFGYTYNEFQELSPFHLSKEPNLTDRNLKLLLISGKTRNTSKRLCKNKKGEDIWVEIQDSLVTLNNKNIICSIYRNITDRIEAMQALKKSENTFRMLVEHIDDIFWIFNKTERKIVYISPQYNKITGRIPTHIKTDFMNILQYCHPSDIGKVKSALMQTLSGKATSVEYRITTNDNKIKWLYLKSVGHFDVEENQHLIFGLVSDITSQKNEERKLRNAILETESKEREMFAKELHDGLGASLSSIKMSLERLNDPKLKPEKKEFYSKYALELINEAAEAAREISYSLKPHTLSNLGLLASIDALCRNMNDLEIMEVAFINDCKNIDLEDEVQLSIYRIINELLNNSLKYSEAQNVYINLSINNKKLNLIYSDNGKGFDVEKAKKARGIGIKNIISRIEALGGKIELHSKLNKGTNVLIQLN